MGVTHQIQVGRCGEKVVSMAAEFRVYTTQINTSCYVIVLRSQYEPKVKVGSGRKMLAVEGLLEHCTSPLSKAQQD
jgi:hypothetical protein